ncbi:MAG: universal stress protein [Thiobacillus sp.]
MDRIRCVVAATDFSSLSEQVVQRAARIASQHQAELHVVHVVRPLDLYPGLTLAPEESSHHDTTLQQAEHTRLDEQASALAKQFDVRIHTATRLGRAHTEIVAYAQKVGADLLVAGARGESTLKDLFLGSTVSRLMSVATCPVLIVKTPADAPYRQVLAAVDFSPVSSAVIEHAISLADGAQVDTLHVLGSEVEQRLRKARFVNLDITDWLARMRTEAEKQLRTLLGHIDNGASVRLMVQPGVPPEAICQQGRESQADLVVLGRHGHGGGSLQDWLLGSVSKGVAQTATCDVLLISPTASA